MDTCPVEVEEGEEVAVVSRFWPHLDTFVLLRPGVLRYGRQHTVYRYAGQ